MSGAHETILNLLINQHPEAHDLMVLLVDAEAQARQQLYLRTSKMQLATLHNIDPSLALNLTSDQLGLLSDLAWIFRGEGILITVAKGCGKSYLACALGHHACTNGYRTLYFNFIRFCEQIILGPEGRDRCPVARQSLAAHPRRIRSPSYTYFIKLLLIFEDLYERNGTIIVSQLPIDKWHEIFLPSPPSPTPT